MNLSTILGMLFGIALIGGTIALTADDFWMFLNLPSLIMQGNRMNDEVVVI